MGEIHFQNLDLYTIQVFVFVHLLFGALCCTTNFGCKTAKFKCHPIMLSASCAAVHATTGLSTHEKLVCTSDDLVRSSKYDFTFQRDKLAVITNLNPT